MRALAVALWATNTAIHAALISAAPAGQHSAKTEVVGGNSWLADLEKLLNIVADHVERIRDATNGNRSNPELCTITESSANSARLPVCADDGCKCPGLRLDVDGELGPNRAADQTLDPATTQGVAPGADQATDHGSDPATARVTAPGTAPGTGRTSNSRRPVGTNVGLQFCDEPGADTDYTSDSTAAPGTDAATAHGTAPGAAAVVGATSKGRGRDGADVGLGLFSNRMGASNPLPGIGIGAGGCGLRSNGLGANSLLGIDDGGLGTDGDLAADRLSADPAAGPVVVNYDDMFGGMVTITATEAEDGAGGLEVQHTESGGIHITCKGISVCNPVTIINGKGGRRINLAKLEKAVEKARKKAQKKEAKKKKKGRWRFRSRFRSPSRC
ncbi:hypothetical protein B0I37DRAFT_355808 [Chaetomium sp. MPI-CAGE-AT-0009]|nr:hypothetical protein B0I37DRAFT_355808 [Chaetomium sp. MPI-CAGE-AT-0009]